jgi:endonuclease I
MFESWSHDDPVDEWERERAGEIYEVQGGIQTPLF